MYDKDRRPWQIVESGPESGVYQDRRRRRQVDAAGGGLPTGKIGRIGLDIYQKNPLILYALLENQNPKRRRGGGRAAQASAPSRRSRRASSATSSIARTTAARRGGR